MGQLVKYPLRLLLRGPDPVCCLAPRSANGDWHYFTVFCAFVFFVFFGFADEARRNYRIVYISFAKKIGLLTGTDSSRTWTGTGFVVLLV